jgi:hypothetical protein
MARLSPVPIVGGAYTDETRPYDQQECVNYLPEFAENAEARSPGILRGVPGLTLFVDTEADAIRGVRNVEGMLFVVADTTLYQVATDGTLTSRGTITGTDRVSMTHNQQANGYQLVIVNGPEGFVYNTATETLTQITDTDFKGSIVCDFINSYITHIEPLRKFWFHSDLADALSYLSTDEYEAESSPDRLVSQVVNHSEVWMFGERTTEIFVNTAAENATFERQSGTIIEQGCAARFSPVNLDNSIFWLGNDGIVYRADGYTPVRVSTHAVEQSIAESDWSEAIGMAWSDRGHKVYYLTFPNGKTWGYDAATRLWHRRASYELDVWRVQHLVFWNGQWIGGDAFNGKLYTLDWDNFTENDAPMVAMRRTPYAHASGNRIVMPCLELLMDTGFDTLDGDQSVWLRYSDDGGKTYTNYRKRMLGTVHQYGQRIRFLRLGSFRNRVFEIMVSSNVKRDLIAASAQMEVAA